MSSSASRIEAVVKTQAGVVLLRVARPVLFSPLAMRVRVLCAGLCRTDLHVALGRTPCAVPRILGHELSGEVVEMGAQITDFELGDRVAISPLLACDACAACLRGAPCDAPRMLGVDRDGGFAEEIVVPSSAVYRVPSALSLERAAYVEPVAATLAVTQAPISREGRGLVVGAGRIAELTRRVLEACGFESVNVSAASPSLEATEYDWAIDTQGSSESLAHSMCALRRGGLLVLKSRPEKPAMFEVARAVERELRLQAVRYAPFREAIALLASENFVVEDLFGATYALSEFERAFAAAEASEAKKIFFAPNGERA